MKTYHVILMIGAIAISGCGLNRNAQLRQSAVKALDQSDVPTLRAEARALWQQYEETNAFDIPEANWPDSFQGFNPVRVFRDDYGIYVVTAKFVSKTTGVYIVVREEHTPEDAPNVSHELLAEGISWTLGS